MAKQLNIGNSTISNYETGYSTPDSEMIKKIADFFGVSTDYLLGRTDDPSPSVITKSSGVIARLDENRILSTLENIEKALRKQAMLPGKAVLVPILGRIRAGMPLYAEQHIEGYEEMGERLVQDGEYFLLRVEGDSMINARIFDGDLVLVRRQSDVDSGDIAVVLVDGEDATLKRVIKLEHGIILQPENPKYKPMFFSCEEIENGAIQILGKVIRAIFDVR